MSAPSPCSVTLFPALTAGPRSHPLAGGAATGQPPPPFLSFSGTCSPGSEGEIRVPSAAAPPPPPLPARGPPVFFSRPRARLPRRGCPRAGGSERAVTSHPGCRGRESCRPPGPPPRDLHLGGGALFYTPSPPGFPAFPGHRCPQGNKETQPGPAPRRRCLPAVGPPAASAPAAARSAAAFPLPGTWRRGGAAAGRPPAVPERG